MTVTTDEPAGVGDRTAGHPIKDLEYALERSVLIALATEDTIWDWDLKTNHLEFSSKVAKFGYDYAAIQPTIQWWEDHIHPDDREPTIGAVAWALQSGKKSFSVEYRFCKANGDFAYIYDRAYIMYDGQGVAVRAVGAMVDVTELRMVRQTLRKTENQLALVSRLNAMGTMGSMIAHELSQPLTAATNFIRASRHLSVSRKSDDVALLHQALEAAEKNTLRAGKMIRRLRELVARGDASGCETPLVPLIEEGCSIGLGIEHLQTVRFISSVDPAGMTVWVDPIQVQQVLVNLVRNSVEAFDNIDDPNIIVRAVKRGNFAEISVQDNGTGISDKLRPSIFSAIMTAKVLGMGIGLSISRTIIEAQGGEIWLANSAPGLTDFRFTLPLYKPDASSS